MELLAGHARASRGGGEGDDLAFSLASPTGVDLMIEALDGGRPDATGHPDRAALARSDDGFTPIGLAFFDMAVIPALAPPGRRIRPRPGQAASTTAGDSTARP